VNEKTNVFSLLRTGLDDAIKRNNGVHQQQLDIAFYGVKKRYKNGRRPFLFFAKIAEDLFILFHFGNRTFQSKEQV